MAHPRQEFVFRPNALGSVIETISAAPNSAAVQGNQVYSPYGSPRYQQGSIDTTKGFTGQYNDAVTGLDYYNARYYDPVVGRFLSVDKASGNMQGADSYAYVGNNPETKNDPTGQRFISASGQLGPRNSIVSPESVTTSLLFFASGATTPPASPPPLDLTVLSSPTSCAVPMSQATCGFFGVLYAFYGRMEQRPQCQEHSASRPSRVIQEAEVRRMRGLKGILLIISAPQMRLPMSLKQKRGCH